MGKLLTLPTNIRLRWKSLAVTNALAYNITVFIITTKVYSISPRSDLDKGRYKLILQNAAFSKFCRNPVYIF